MKIRTRIQVIIVLSVFMAATVGLLLFLSIQAMNEASRKAGVAAEVVKGVVELKILTSGYLLHPGDRTLIQWRSRYDSVTKRLTGGYFRSPDEKTAVDQILRNLKRIKTVFTEITIGMRKKQQSGKQESAISRALQDRLEAELLVKTQAAVSLVFPLQQKIQAELVTTQKRAAFLTVLLLLTLMAVIVGISLWINKSIARPIAKLEEDTQIIGSGNLDYKVGTTAKDEIGQLSRAFDKMTVDLKKTTASIVELNKEIDERKQAEGALRESEEKYRSMMEAMDEAVYICSPDYRVEYVNPAMVKRTSWDAIGEPCYKAIYELDEKCPWCVHDKVQQGESLETEIVSPKDGRSYHISHSPIFHEDGSISKMTILRDITERKKADEVLRESQERLSSFMDSATDGFILFDSELNYIDINKSALEITGLDRKEFIGSVHPESVTV